MRDAVTYNCTQILYGTVFMTCTTPYELEPEELIRTLIRAAWSQEEIAEAIEVTQPTICRILSGKHKDPRYSIVKKLRALVLKLTDLVDLPTDSEGG